MVCYQVFDDVHVARHTGSQQRGHACKKRSTNVMLRHRRLSKNHVTISVDIDLGVVSQQELHDVQTSGLGAVVQRRVALHRLAVDVCVDGNQKPSDLVVTFVTSDHQACMTVAICDFDIWKYQRKIFLIIYHFFSFFIFPPRQFYGKS